MKNKTTLLVIDMQNDFMEKSGFLEVHGIRKNIQKFKTFIDVLRSRRVAIVYTRHCFNPKNNPIEVKLFPKLKRRGLRKGSEGWEIYDDLKPQKGDIVLDKTRYDAFFNTNLNKILKALNTKTVIITGTMTEVCCDSTARTAMFYDYDVIFCSDMTYTHDRSIRQKTMTVFKNHFGKVMRSNKILKFLKIK